jgi:hypothetical protein
MSMNDPSQTRTMAPQASEVRGRATESLPRPRVRDLRETKPSFMTTEFWAMVAGIVALVVVYNVADDSSLDLWRTCLLATVIASAYMLSRGFAKSGSHDDKWTDPGSGDRY